MQVRNSLLIALALLIVGCENKKSHSNKETAGQGSTEVKQKKAVDKPVVNVRQSIVISCGSGCAMSYSPKAVNIQSGSIKVNFEVKMYEDEALTDSYDETYVFYYTDAKKVEKIIKDGEKDDVLKTLMPASQRAFIEFGENLVEVKDSANTPM
ncbi:hypothetical protein [Mucilaginibacter aquatilis]|uniref:Uncharacterized protein n=1 Tax=Mucilaginibacter aquatilis TaxID=1517760 RepID=A0A6I4IGW6_9SPHI|nr:hypothetical protein [Mucilaginibacter aquatilis]MVN92599.1 hypothetical protein [Mucilaginibacter aquatilis]